MIIGVTGGIGSGKSSVTNILAKYLQVSAISADEVSHAVTGKNGSAIHCIKKDFGSELILEDGSMDRKKMRELIFNNPEKKRELEELLKPFIHAGLEFRIQECLKDSPFAVVEIPLLYETKTWIEKCDEIVVVDCEESIQIERVMKRNNLTAEEVKKIIDTQATREQRKSIGTYIIENNGYDVAELVRKTQHVALNFLKKMA